MRPIEKGAAPDVEFKKYSEAEPFLEERLGAYCSFCEFPIKHVPKVEHNVAKSQGGEVLNWSNLLLSCKYCNTRKGAVVKKGEKENYLWPDEDDTFHCFSYDNGFPKLNSRETYLTQIKMLAKATGFFSTWMNVFCDEADIRSVLIEVFKGTKKEYCED